MKIYRFCLLLLTDLTQEVPQEGLQEGPQEGDFGSLFYGFVACEARVHFLCCLTSLALCILMKCDPTGCGIIASLTRIFAGSRFEVVYLHIQKDKVRHVGFSRYNLYFGFVSLYRCIVRPSS